MQSPAKAYMPASVKASKQITEQIAEYFKIYKYIKYIQYKYKYLKYIKSNT
jgi:hypothetical protein